jgi:hypothetical protein
LASNGLLAGGSQIGIDRGKRSPYFYGVICVLNLLLAGALLLRSAAVGF